MQTQRIAGIAALILICSLSTLSPVVAGPEAEGEIASPWLRHAVILDGQITTAQEWSDAVSADLTLLEKHVGPAAISSRWWVKNDAEWLYLLARVPMAELEAYGAHVVYFWPYPCCPWEHSDYGWVDQDDDTFDGYDWDGTSWYNDTLASPPGENDVEGAASADGIYYWFEFRKALDSGDGYDWSWAPGETVGTGQTGDLMLGIYDRTVPTHFDTFIQLRLASASPYGHALETLEDLTVYSPRLFGSGTASDDAIGAVYDAAMYIQQKLESYGLETSVEEFAADQWQYSNYRLAVDYDGDLGTGGDRVDLTGQSTPFRYSGYAADPYGLTLLTMEITGTIRHDPDGNLVLSSPAPGTWEEDLKLGTTNILMGLPALTSTDAAYSSSHFGTIDLERPLFESVEGQVVDDTSLVIFGYRMEKKALTGYNVVGKIEGEDEREVILTAHYDTVYTDGAIDNGSGVVTLLEVARRLANYHHQHDVYFVFFDGEELGLLGSQDYVSNHASEMSDAITNINVDCVASGSDNGMTIGADLRYPEAWADLWWGYQQVSTPAIDDFVSGIAQDMIGFDPGPFYPEDIGGGGADFASFAGEGITTTNVMWLDLDKADAYPGISDQQVTADYVLWKTVDDTDYYRLPGSFHTNLSYIHTSYDDLTHVSVQYLADTIEILTEATFRLAGGTVKVYLPLVVKDA